MKKLILVLLVLFLAVPALSNAGTATSRWDLTIGGWVKFDATYSNRAMGVGGDVYWADRDNLGANRDASKENGAFQMFGGDTVLNFSVKGPDAWGAKTMAFIEGDFRGQTTNGGQAGTRNGTFSLRHAFMKFNWAATELLVGHTWQAWGLMPTFNLLGSWDMLGFMKGARQAQVRVSQNFSKDFQGTIGVFSPSINTDALGYANAYNLTYAPQANGVMSNNTGSTRGAANWPHLFGELLYKTDACGKIGPWGMQFGISGFIGQDEIIYVDQVTTNSYKSDSLRSWAAAFKGFIPIIPEKKGDKTGALSVTGQVFTGRNLQVYEPGRNGPLSITPFDADGTVGVNYAAPTLTGFWAQLSYNITDSVSLSGLYGYRRLGMGERARQAFAGIVDKNQHYIVNLMYNVNPAVRLGVEYTYIASNYNAYGSAGQLTGWAAAPAGTTLDTKGSVQTGRVAAWYFF